MIDFTQLKYFAKLAEVLSFTEAAKQLFITQSTLSQSIAKMERELGVQLFDRIGHRLYLNEAGKLFFPNAVETIRHAEEGIQKLRDMQQIYLCDLHIGVTYSLCPTLVHGLSLFSHRFPQVKIRVSYSTSISEILESVKTNKMDFAITYRPSPLDPSIEGIDLFHSPLCVILDKQHPLASLDSISLEELANYPLILPTSGLHTRKLLDNLLSRKGFALNPTIEVNEISMITQVLYHSQWVSILTQNSVLGNPFLKAVPLVERSGLMRASILWPKGGYKKKMAKELADILLNE
ncbi:MAG: LysR family transcriptional regulator [Bacteroidales bacterium]|nr:LysR family transcriptional regulator [Bacteroidales bacterium]